MNGAVLTTPAHVVSSADTILVDGEPLPAARTPRLWRYNKPKGLVTSHKDPEGRPTVFGALPDTLPRVVSVGRLDINTEGLLLLTTDGALATASSNCRARAGFGAIAVRAHGRVSQGALDALKRGITIDGIRYGHIEATNRTDSRKQCPG